MQRNLSCIAIGAILAFTTAAFAQQYDPNVYPQMVDASSAETIPPGTRITFQNWSRYKNFFPYFIQLGYQGQMHFHVIDSPDYAIEVGPTEDFLPPKAMRDYTEKYAGQTKLVPDSATGGFTWSGYQAGTPFPDPNEPNRAAKIMYNTWAGYFQPFGLHDFSHNWETDSFGNVQPEDTDDTFYRLMHLSDPPYPTNLADAGGNIIANRFIEITPEQAKYTTSLELYPEDPARLTEEYVFLPSLRRSLPCPARRAARRSWAPIILPMTPIGSRLSSGPNTSARRKYWCLSSTRRSLTPRKPATVLSAAITNPASRSPDGRSPTTTSGSCARFT
jgi:Protein of unknown function (DUF1329)